MNPPAYGTWNGQKVVLGTGEDLLGSGLRVREACPPITGKTGKWRCGREVVGWGGSSSDGRDNTTLPERSAPTSSMQAFVGRGCDECPTG
jgi:hypothetical protein